MNEPVIAQGQLSPGVGERPTWVRWQIVALLMAFSFMTWFNRVSMSAAYNERIHEQYGMSEEDIGWVYSAFFFVYTLFMTPGGWFIDRFGPRLALVWMGFGSAIFVAMTGLVCGFVQAATVLFVNLLVVRGIMGAFTAPIYPAGARIASHWVPYSRRVWANGLIQGAAGLGIACSAVLFGLLVDCFDRNDWPRVFFITGLVTALLALVWSIWARNYPAEHGAVNEAEKRLIEVGAPLGTASSVSTFFKARWSFLPWRRAGAGQDIQPDLPVSATQRVQEKNKSEDANFDQEQPKPQDELVQRSAKSLWRNRSLVCLTLAYAAVNYFEYLFFFWMQFYFKDKLELGTVESRWYYFTVNMAFAVGMVLGGWLSDKLTSRYGRRLGRTIVPVVGMLAGAGLLLAGLAATQPGWIVTWFALALGAVGMCEAPTWTLSVELGGRQGATAAGMCNTGGNIGGFLAPIVTPWISKQFGWYYGIMLGSLVCLVGVGLWWWVDPSEGSATTDGGKP